MHFMSRSVNLGKQLVWQDSFSSRINALKGKKGLDVFTFINLQVAILLSPVQVGKVGAVQYLQTDPVHHLGKLGVVRAAAELVVRHQAQQYGDQTLDGVHREVLAERFGRKERVDAV